MIRILKIVGFALAGAVGIAILDAAVKFQIAPGTTMTSFVIHQVATMTWGMALFWFGTKLAMKKA